MKFSRKILFALVAVLIIKIALADECSTFPVEINMNLDLCCDFPNVSDNATHTKVEELAQNIPENGTNNYLFACKVAQIVFEEMKLVKDNIIDKDLYAKMIESRVPKEMDYWKQPLKEAFDQCQKALFVDMSKITDLFSKEPFNIKQDECDAQYFIMFMCLHLDSFVHCPDRAWKVKADDQNHESCNTVKTWLGKCGKDLNALQKIVVGASAAY